MDRFATSNPPGKGTLGVLAALTAFLLASALSFWPYTVDDAFISLRYGQNLVAHGELVWNPGEAVEGFSNPLWTLYGAALVASARVFAHVRGARAKDIGMPKFFQARP